MLKTDIFEVRLVPATTETLDKPPQIVTNPGVEYYIKRGEHSR